MIISLLGYYGSRNVGDDLMLEALLDYYSADARITRIYVFVKDDPCLKHTKKLTIVPWRGIRTLIRRAYCIAVSRYAIWGGGTCLYEIPGAGNRDLQVLLAYMMIARILRTRFVFCGIGLGDLFTEKRKAIVRKVLQLADKVIFREEASRRRARHLTGEPRHYELGGDLFFANDYSPYAIVRRNPDIRNLSFSGFYKYADDAHLVAFYARLLDALVKELSIKVHFIPFHQDGKDDNIFHKEIAATMTSGAFEIVRYDRPLDVFRHLQHMDFHLGMRLHSIAAADCINLPNIGINYSPKVRYYIEKQGVSEDGRLVDVGEHITAEQVRKVYREYSFNEGFIRDERSHAEKSMQMSLMP